MAVLETCLPNIEGNLLPKHCRHGQTERNDERREQSQSGRGSFVGKHQQQQRKSVGAASFLSADVESWHCEPAEKWCPLNAPLWKKRWGGTLTVVAVLVMNRHIVALRRLIVAAESERWYDATLAPVICNRRLCASGWGLLSLPSLPSLPNCKLIIFFQITPPPPPPPKLRRASCQMLQWAGFIWKSTCRRTLMCLKHLNVALSRTGSEYRCAAGTQIACFLMKQVFGCISCCMLKHHRRVSPNDHPVYTVILPTDWELGCWCLVPAGIVAGPCQTTPFQTASLAHLPAKV